MFHDPYRKSVPYDPAVTGRVLKVEAQKAAAVVLFYVGIYELQKGICFYQRCIAGQDHYVLVILPPVHGKLRGMARTKLLFLP